MNQTTILLPGANAELRQGAQNQNLLVEEAASELRLGKDRLACSLGLPGIGSRLTNVHGMEWRVVGHTHAASPVSVQSNGGQMVLDDPHDVMPIIGPENLSPRLDTFFREVNLCTSKGFLFLDTAPHIRTNRAHPFGHSVYDTDNPNCITFMLDAVNINETILAHELGHVWLRLVEDCEYEYHLNDITDPAKVRMVNYVQSFVLDRRVNEVIEERGFDVSCIRDAHQESMFNFALAVSLGHLPPYRFESVFTALVIANELLDTETPVDGQGSRVSCSIQPDENLPQVLDLMAVLREGMPEIYELAEAFAASVLRNGYRGRDAIAHSIEECLQLAFDFAGIDFEAARDFHLVPFVEPLTDKFPEFLSGFPVAAKLEAGKAMAGKNLPWPLQYALHTTPHGYTTISFLDGQGQWTPPVVLLHAPCQTSFDPSDPRSPLFSGHGNPSDPYRHLPPQVRGLWESQRLRTAWPSEPLGVNFPPGLQMPGPYDHLPEQVRAVLPPLPGTQLPGFSRSAAQLPRGEQNVYKPPSTHVGGFGPSKAMVTSLRTPRNYMAGEGLWLSRARLQEQLAGEHPYGYANNNPLSYVDPEGAIPRQFTSVPATTSPQFPARSSINPATAPVFDELEHSCNPFNAAAPYLTPGGRITYQGCLAACKAVPAHIPGSVCRAICVLIKGLLCEQAFEACTVLPYPRDRSCASVVVFICGPEI